MKAKAQIFLSYAREDKEKVENLYHNLSDAGFRPWMDKKDILPGERWKSRIQKAIRRSDFFLVCLSANSVNKRGWIQREIKDALDIWQEKLEDDIYLIPVRLEDCEAPERLREFQWVDLFDEDGWTQLVKAIQVGMERRAEGVKSTVQEPISSEPYPPYEKPSPDTEMVTPEEGPERVQSKLVQLTSKPVEITAGVWADVTLQLRNTGDKGCEDLVLTLRVPWPLSTKKTSLRLAHLGPNSTGQIPVRLKASRSAPSLVKFDIDLHYFSAGVPISQRAQLELRIRPPVPSPKPASASERVRAGLLSPEELHSKLVSHFDEEARAFLESELAQRRRNIYKLRKQKSIYAVGEEPLYLLNQIEAEEAEIARIEAELKQLER